MNRWFLNIRDDKASLSCICQDCDPFNLSNISVCYISVQGFPDGSAGKEFACNVGDLVRSLDWEDALEKEKATHSSILAWRIPQTV